MKNRLNITIEGTLIEQAKRYAAKNNVSLSQLVEESLKRIVGQRPAKKQNILDFLKTMQKPQGDVERLSKDTYYEDNKKKYGF
jgi:hypothetical protein